MARPKQDVVMSRVFRLRISDAMYEKVKRVALESNITPTEVIRRAIMWMILPDQSSTKALSKLHTKKRVSKDKTQSKRLPSTRGE